MIVSRSGPGRWVGQYDLILSTSDEGAKYLKQLQPFKVDCFTRCPLGGTSVEMFTPVGVLTVQPFKTLLPRQMLVGHQTYVMQVEELEKMLAENNLIKTQRGRSCHDTTKKHQMCILTRLHAGQYRSVVSFLNSLIFQDSPDIESRIFLVNTDVNKSMRDGRTFEDHRRNDAAKINDETTRCSVHLLTPPFTPNPRYYGYDATDWALEILLESGGCTHVMVTNGDNYYVPSLMGALTKELNAGKELVAFDFLTHHPRSVTTSSR